MAFLRKRGDVYYVYWYDPITKKTKGKSTKTSDKRRAIIFKNQIEQKVLDVIESQSDIIVIGLEDALSEYLNYRKEIVSPQSFHTTKYTLGKFIKTINKQISFAHEIDADIINKYIESDLKNSAGYTKAKYVREIKVFLKYLIENNMHDDNGVISKIKNIKVKRNDIIPFDIETLNRIFTEGKKYTTPINFNMLKFIAYSGIRVGEIYKIKWEHVNYDKNLILLHSSKENPTKNKLSRYIPLIDPLIEVLEEMKDPEIRSDYKRIWDDEFIFPRLKSKVYYNRTLMNAFKKIQTALNISPIRRIHDLRHTYVTILYSYGVDPITIKAIVGHANFEMVERYLHINAENLSSRLSTLFSKKP